jgi:hypothetical protein
MEILKYLELSNNENIDIKIWRTKSVAVNIQRRFGELNGNLVYGKVTFYVNGERIDYSLNSTRQWAFHMGEKHVSRTVSPVLVSTQNGSRTSISDPKH